MSSPNEPVETGASTAGAGDGSPASAERPSAGSRSGSSSGPWLGDTASRPTESIEPVEAPPWQRAAGRGQQSGPRPALETTASADPRPASGPVSTTSSPDSRISRYVTGTAAPAALQETTKTIARDSAPTAVRTEVARPVEYASELPDLSGLAPRTSQQRRAEQAPPASSQAATSSSGKAVTTPPRSAGRLQVGPRGQSGPVRATMQIRHIDPWSALKVSLLLSVALFFVWMIAVAFLYLVLGGMGVWSKLNSNVGDLLTNNSGAGGELVSAGSIFGGALLIGLVNIVLLTAMATIGAFVYNLSTDIVGGVEVTLADRD